MSFFSFIDKSYRTIIKLLLKVLGYFYFFQLNFCILFLRIKFFFYFHFLFLLPRVFNKLIEMYKMNFIFFL